MLRHEALQVQEGVGEVTAGYTLMHQLGAECLLVLVWVVWIVAVRKGLLDGLEVDLSRARDAAILALGMVIGYLLWRCV